MTPEEETISALEKERDDLDARLHEALQRIDELEDRMEELETRVEERTDLLIQIGDLIRDGLR